MPITPTNAERLPHIAAIRRSIDAGFTFLHLPEYPGGPVGAIHAERRIVGAVETYTLRDMTEAIAARYRAEDYPHGHPVWQLAGTVADVISELLALPGHGTPAAPNRTTRPSSSLWLPASML